MQNIEQSLQQALEFCQQGRFSEAKALYEALLQSHPDQPKALTNLAAIEFQSGHTAVGLELIQRSIALDANQPYAFYNASNELLKLKRYDEAFAYCNHAIALKPDFAEAYNNLGVALEHLQQPQEALTNYDRAIAFKPHYVEAHNNRGVILHHLHRFDDALTSYERALALKPDYAKAHNNRGNLLKDLEQLDAALICYDRAIGLAPNFAEAHFNRGVILASLDRLNEAMAAYDKAIELRPDYADAYCNHGYIFQQLNNLGEALAYYDRAIELDDGCTQAKWNKAFLLLLRGEYGEGWKLHELRWETCQKDFRRHFSQPLWLGDQPIAGKTLLIYAEQGLGDFIQFCRYAPMAAALGAHVVLEVPAPLLSLVNMSLMNTLQGNFTLVEKFKALPHFDMQCPLLSLPLAFHTSVQTIPANIPYLAVDENAKDKWKKRLGHKNKPRIGLVWAGSATNRKRTIPLQQLEPLLRLPFEFHCLQKEVGAGDILALADSGDVCLHHDQLIDFSDTAALMAELDLIISVDTAAAHLAGAMGLPVWILLPFAPDFRWLTDRQDSPWYPSAKLYRQGAMNDWHGVVADVAHDLKKWI